MKRLPGYDVLATTVRLRFARKYGRFSRLDVEVDDAQPHVLKAKLITSNQRPRMRKQVKHDQLKFNTFVYPQPQVLRRLQRLRF